MELVCRRKPKRNVKKSDNERKPDIAVSRKEEDHSTNRRVKDSKTTNLSQFSGGHVSIQPDGIPKDRNVLFSDIVTVFKPTDWSPDEYREARKGYWMQIAADRYRFRRRISRTETELGTTFSADHREKIFNRLCVCE